MICLLDTSACVHYFRRSDSAVRPWLASVNRSSVFLCSVVRAELLVGIRKRPVERQRLILMEFLAAFGSLPFDDAAAEVYADIRADLERQGQVIGPYDMQIAAIAVTHGATLVTGNLKEFQRVPSLSCLSLEDLVRS